MHFGAASSDPTAVCAQSLASYPFRAAAQIASSAARCRGSSVSMAFSPIDRCSS
jgi:hypothetical protein